MADNKTPILIIGTDSSARIALDIANAHDVLVYGFLTNDPETLNQELNDILVVAALDSKDGETLLSDENVKIIIAEKDHKARIELAEDIEEQKKNLINLVHPVHNISPYAKIGNGNIVEAAATIGPNVEMGDHNHIGPSVVIQADAQIGSFCTIEAGAVIGEKAIIEDGATVGAAAVIQDGISVEEDAKVVAGSVVVKTVEGKTTVFGVPAQKLDL